MHNLTTSLSNLISVGIAQTTNQRTLLSGYIKSVAKLCNIQIDGRFLVNALEIEYNTTLEASLYFFSPQIFLFGVQAAFSEN